MERLLVPRIVVLLALLVVDWPSWLANCCGGGHEPGQLFTEDGRKRADVDFVGAGTPDTDADRPLPQTPRKKR